MRTGQWAASTGYAGLAAGLAAVAFERPWPATSHPAQLPRFVVENHDVILAQSMFFLASAACFLWFLGSLRDHLAAAEGGTTRLSTLAFAAGMIGYALEIVGQAPQLTLTLPSAARLSPGIAAALTDLGFVTLTIANLPLAVMYAAMAVVSLRTGAFPAWLGGLAALASGAALALTGAVISPTGPLGPQGWASYALYPAAVLFLIPAVTLLVRADRPGQPPVRPSEKDRP